MRQSTYLKSNQKLFCPGPVNVAQNVREAVATYEIGHREKEFSCLLKSLNSKLLSVFEVEDTTKYLPVVITGSGTAANEAVLSSVAGDKAILVVSNGEFGERLSMISSFHNPRTHHIKLDWGQPLDLKVIERYIKENNIKLLAVVHHETSTGMLNPIKKLGKIAQKNSVVYIVDTVSSAGAEKIEIEKSNIAFCTSSASKAIGSLPGVSFVIGKKSEFNKLKNIKAKTIYLDLYNFYKYSIEKLQTPNTPAVQTFIGLDQALTNILIEGVTKRNKYIKSLTLVLREQLSGLGFRPLISDPKLMSSVLTTFLAPRNFDIEGLKTKLREKNIIIYSGKGPLANKVFQVGNIGNLTQGSVNYFLASLKDCLLEMGYLTKSGSFKTVSKTHSRPIQL